MTVNRSGFLLETYELKIVKLKKIIKKKWRGKKDLPGFKVSMQNIKEGDEMFNPVEYFDGDHQQYFSKLQVWKQTLENNYLERYSFLREQIRHKEIYIKPSWFKHYR